MVHPNSHSFLFLANIRRSSWARGAPRKGFAWRPGGRWALSWLLQQEVHLVHGDCPVPSSSLLSINLQGEMGRKLMGLTPLPTSPRTRTCRRG